MSVRISAHRKKDHGAGSSAEGRTGAESPAAEGPATESPGSGLRRSKRQSIDDYVAGSSSVHSRSDPSAVPDPLSSSSRVYVLSEVAYDSSYFNETAYRNLLDFLSRDADRHGSGETGILVDGAITRLDRPEYLNDRLTYWEKSEDECKHASESIRNREQYKHMMDIQLGMVSERLHELREKAPDSKIVFSLHCDDIQYTASAMLNEMLVRGQQQIGESIHKLKNKKDELKKKRKDFQQDFSSLKEVKGASRERSSLKRKIATCTRKVDNIENRLTDLYEEKKLYREKKVRPSHQFFTREFIDELYERYRKVCEDAGVELVTQQSTLEFGNLRIDYAHSRHQTWNVLKTRDKQLVKSLHGKLPSLKGIDVVLESGHFGIGYKQLQKIKDSPDETNFKEQSSFAPPAEDEHVTFVMALPFEDQEKIGSYVRGERSVRTSSGKPMGSRKIAATDRYMKDGVSGLTIIDKDDAGIISTEWLEYRKFADGSVLEQPSRYNGVFATADEHIGSPEFNPLVLEGAVALYHRLLSEGSSFRGRPLFAKGYINGGDVAEANSKKWDHRYHHKRNPHDLIRENISLLKDFRPENLEDVLSLALKMTDDALGGSVESMDVILDWVADYFDRYLDKTLDKSGLEWAHLSTTGNHADAILRDVGLKEYAYFAQRLRARGIDVCEVGKPAHPRQDHYLESPLYHSQDNPRRNSQGMHRDPRVFLGGYSNARVLNIPDYGLDTDGRVLFGPVNLVLQHDPKGSGMNGTIGAGKNVDADVSLSAHTHDNRLKLYRRSENSFGVAYKLATLQGVSPTEKYYASSVTRTRASHLLVMNSSGDFSEKAFPVDYLRKIGLDSLSSRNNPDPSEGEEEDS